MSELTKALLKHRRYPDANEVTQNLTEELAHVLISIEVLRKIYGISDSAIEQESEKKHVKYNMPSPLSDKDYPWNSFTEHKIEKLSYNEFDKLCKERGLDVNETRYSPEMMDKIRSIIDTIKEKLIEIKYDREDTPLIFETLIPELFNEALDEYESLHGE